MSTEQLLQLRANIEAGIHVDQPTNNTQPATPDNATAKAAAQKVAYQASNKGRGNTSYARNEYLAKNLARNQDLAAANVLTYEDIHNANFWNQTKGRGHASTARDNYLSTSPAVKAYQQNKNKGLSTLEWWRQATARKSTADSAVDELQKQIDALIRGGDSGHISGRVAGEKWSRTSVPTKYDELQKLLDSALHEQRMAEADLGFAEQYKNQDWYDNLLEQGTSWADTYDALAAEDARLGQLYNEKFNAIEYANQRNTYNSFENAAPFLDDAGMAALNEELKLLEEHQKLTKERIDIARQLYATGDPELIAKGEQLEKQIRDEAQIKYTQNLREYISSHENAATTGGAVVDILMEDETPFMPTDKWGQTQIDIYRGLLGNGRIEEARQYATEVNTKLNNQSDAAAVKGFETWGYRDGEAGIGRALAGTALSVLSAPEELVRFIDKANHVKAQGVYVGDDDVWLSDYSKALTEGVSKSFNEQLSFGNKGLGDLYQVGNSMVQSLVYGGGLSMLAGNVIAKGTTLATFFGQAANDSFDEAIARGATGEQAVTIGILSGAAEVLAEKLPLDNLLDLNKSAARGLARSILKQAGLEGAEEGVTEIVNMLADEFVMGDKSRITQGIRQRMEQGQSYEDAYNAEWTQFAKDVAWSVAAGALSGGVSTVVMHGADAVSPYTANKQNQYRYGADAQTLVNEAKQIKDIKPTVDRAQKRLDKGKSISNATAKKLTTTANRSRVVDAVETQINVRAGEIDEKTARSLANAIVAKTRNEGLTQNQQKLIAKHEKLASTLEKELDPKKPAEWAQTIGVRGAEAASYGSRNVANAVEAVENKVLTGGEYAEARKNLVEKGQDKIEFTEDFDYVAEVHGNTSNYESFDEVWNAIKDDTVLTEDQARAAWQAGKEKLQAADTSARLTRHGTGKVSFGELEDGDVTYMAPEQDEIDSFKRGARYQYLEALAKKVGVDIVFFKAGDEGINGKYLNGTVYLAVDASPTSQQSVEGYVMLTAAHELTHYIKEASPARYAELKDFVIKHIIDKGKLEGKNLKQLIMDKRNAYARAHVNLSVDAAIEEIVADACEMMLKDNTLVAQLKGENATLHGKISKWLKKFMAMVRKAFEGLEAHHVEAKAMEDSFKELQRIWNLGLTEAAQAEVMGEFSPGSEGVVENEDGEPVAMSTEDGSVQLSIKTYEDSGRDAFRNYLEKCVSSNRLTEAEMQEMLDGIEEIYQVCKKFKDEYAPFSAWSDAEVIRDTYGKPVFSVVTPNGDYKMNLDFSLVCRKRRTLDAVFNEMTRRGIIDDFELGQKSVVRINEIIRKHGFETACALCFVDARRFRQAAMADSFVQLYNELVKSLVPGERLGEITHFNFGGNEGFKKAEAGKAGIDSLPDKELDFSHIRDVMREYGKGTVEYKAAKYILENAEGRKLLFRGDFMSSAGFDEVKINNKNILKLYNSKKGTGGPKAAFGDVQYMNEILSKSRTWTPGKAYDVGGVRVQSFSDYVPRMVFDYVQMIYDLAAAQLPAHAYTKEALFVKQFGLTGIKINMSLIPAIADDGIAPGLDARGNYVWAGESFDYATAVEVQNAEGYTENCGTICVGVSDDHIRKLIDDPNIRMVIPYHKSGLNPIVAHMNRVAEFTNYEGKQRTRGSDGAFVKKDFDFNKELHRMGADGDPKLVAQMYLDWCADNGYTPKFADFVDSENYYKLLIDFTVYDKSGKYVPQRAVKGVFPKKGDAFGTMSQLIRSGLEEDAVIEGRRDESIGSIVDEIVRSIPKAEADIAEVQVAQAEGDVEAAYTRDISGGKYAIKYDVSRDYYWAQNNDIISAEQQRVLDEAVERISRGYKGFPTAYNGTRIVDYDDALMFVGGTYEEPALVKVITFNIYDSTDKEYAKERITYGEEDSANAAKYAFDAVENIHGYGAVIERTVRTYAANAGQARRGARGNGGRNRKTPSIRESIEAQGYKFDPALDDYVAPDGSLFSERKLSIKDDAQSDRMLLANALMSVAQNDAERRRLNNYKKQIDTIEEIQALLYDKENELSRAYRAKDKAEIAKVQRERDALREKLVRADSKLTELQATKPLKDLLKRVKQDTRRRTQISRRETRSKAELRNKIKTLHKQMSNQLLKPSENKYVPKPLLRTVAELLEEINLDSGRSEKIKAKLTELSGQYKKIAESNESYVYDPVIAEMIANLQSTIATMDDSSIYHMSRENLQMVYDTMKAINHTVRNAVKMIGYEENRDIFELAKAMIHETTRTNPVANKLANKYINATLRPDVFFKRMGGYVKNSVWQMMGDMLNAAQLRQLQIQMEGAAFFEELMREEDKLKEMCSPDRLIDIGLKDEFGETVRVTMDIALKIYMDTMAEDNARHLMYGGYTVPNMREYYKGKPSEAFDLGSVSVRGFGPLFHELEHNLRHAETEEEAAEIQQKIDQAEADAADWVEKLRQNIREQMGEYELRWVEAAERFFNEYSQRVLNETTMAVYGFAKATVPYYVPIHTDAAYRQANFESISRDFSLENSGFMKQRVKASNPMMAEGLVDVVSGQIDRVAKYAGVMPGIRNFEKVYGKTTGGFENSVQRAVGTKFGKDAREYIENLITDLTAPRRTEGGMLGEFADQLRGKLASAALTLNPRVTLEQLTSYPKAAAVIGYEPLLKALRDVRDNPVLSEQARQEIAQWSPLMWYRTQGLFNREMGDIRGDDILKRKTGKAMDFLLKSLEFTEGATVGQMWYAAQYYVEDNTSLERGTDAFMQETAKVFNRIVMQTQANYTTMQRPDILRNPNAIVKQLTMFMTERLQNANMVFDAVGTYNAYLRDFKNGANDVTAEDLREAKLGVARTASSLIAATASSVALKLIVDAIMYNMKGYRDEDEELTMASVNAQLLENFFESVAGNFLWGSEIFAVMRSVITGETYYGISLGGVENFTDAVDAVVKAAQEPSKESLWKLAKSAAQMLGIPANNAIKIYNSYAYRIKDVQEGNDWGTYASEVKMTDEKRNKQLYEAVLDGNQPKIDRLFEHYGTEAAADAALAKHIKSLYMSDELSEKEAIAQLEELASMSAYDAKLTIDKLRFEKEQGFAYEDMKQQYLEGIITGEDAVKFKVDYGDEDKSAAEGDVNQWRMEKETGLVYSKISSYLASGDIDDTTAIKYLMNYGGYDSEEAAAKKVSEWMGEIETGIPADKVEEYYAEGLISRDFLINYYMNYKWWYDEETANRVADKRDFVGKDDRINTITPAAVAAYNEYLADADIDKYFYYTAWKERNAIQSGGEVNGKKYSRDALRLFQIDKYNLQPWQKTLLAQAFEISDKNISRYAPWA